VAGKHHIASSGSVARSLLASGISVMVASVSSNTLAAQDFLARGGVKQDLLVRDGLALRLFSASLRQPRRTGREGQKSGKMHMERGVSPVDLDQR
jgi:hypothetical protein